MADQRDTLSGLIRRAVGDTNGLGLLVIPGASDQYTRDHTSWMFAQDPSSDICLAMHVTWHRGSASVDLRGPAVDHAGEAFWASHGLSPRHDAPYPGQMTCPVRVPYDGPSGATRLLPLLTALTAPYRSGDPARNPQPARAQGRGSPAEPPSGDAAPPAQAEQQQPAPQPGDLFLHTDFLNLGEVHIADIMRDLGNPRNFQVREITRVDANGTAYHKEAGTSGRRGLFFSDMRFHPSEVRRWLIRARPGPGEDSPDLPAAPDITQGAAARPAPGSPSGLAFTGPVGARRPATSAKPPAGTRASSAPQARRRGPQ